MKMKQADIQRCQAAIQSGMGQFKHGNREMLASIPEDIAPRLWAHVRLNPELSKELETGDLFDSGRYKNFFEREFLVLYDRGVFQQAADFTPEGQLCIDNLRRKHNIGEVPPVPVPEPTAAERLEAEVRSDWQLLKTADFRRKCQSNPLYSQTFQRIAGTLGSQVTSAVIAGA